jgi:predicted dehydrogenase
VDRLRFGLVGIGHLGSLHAKMLAGIADVELAGVHDIDQEKARKAAAEFTTTACDSMEQLLVLCDALVIATPTTSHYAIARLALERGKDIFIEKPITQTPAEADQLIRLAGEQGLFVQVGHIERFNPAILALERYRLNPMFVESHRLAQFNPRGTDVAVVLDLMIHDIDLILSFVHSPVLRVDANGVAVVSQSIDIANARLQFENGCVANVTASRISQRRMRKMRMFQRNEYISIDFSEGLAEVFRLVEGGGEPAVGTLLLGELGAGAVKRKIVYEQPEVTDVNPLKYEIELFARSVRERTPPIVSGEDGKRALEVAEMIMRSIGQQKYTL